MRQLVYFVAVSADGFIAGLRAQALAPATEATP